MGEMVLAGYGMDKAVRSSVSFETPCGRLLRELEVRNSVLCSWRP
jgi:protein regulator of cytokinesis 1